MSRMTVVISSSSPPNQTASPSAKVYKEDISGIETKEITSDKRRKMESLTVHVYSCKIPRKYVSHIPFH